STPPPPRAEPLDLALPVVPDTSPLGPDDRGEDPALLVGRELHLDAAAAKDLRRLLHAAAPPRRAGRDEETRPPLGQVPPDLLRHVGQHGMKQREKALEGGERRGGRISVLL